MTMCVSIFLKPSRIFPSWKEEEQQVNDIFHEGRKVDVFSTTRRKVTRSMLFVVHYEILVNWEWRLYGKISNRDLVVLTETDSEVNTARPRCEIFTERPKYKCFSLLMLCVVWDHSNSEGQTIWAENLTAKLRKPKIKIITYLGLA